MSQHLFSLTFHIFHANKPASMRFHSRLHCTHSFAQERAFNFALHFFIGNFALQFFTTILYCNSALYFYIVAIFFTISLFVLLPPALSNLYSNAHNQCSAVDVSFSLFSLFLRANHRHISLPKVTAFSCISVRSSLLQSPPLRTTFCTFRSLFTCTRFSLPIHFLPLPFFSAFSASLLSAYCSLFSILCSLCSALCSLLLLPFPPPFTFYPPSSPLRPLPSTLHSLFSAPCLPSSPLHSSFSILCALRSAFRLSPFAFHSLPPLPPTPSFPLSHHTFSSPLFSTPKYVLQDPSNTQSPLAIGFPVSPMHFLRFFNPPLKTSKHKFDCNLFAFLHYLSLKSPKLIST